MKSLLFVKHFIANTIALPSLINHPRKLIAYLTLKKNIDECDEAQKIHLRCQYIMISNDFIRFKII